MKKVLTLLLLIFASTAFAHDLNYERVIARTWHKQHDGRELHGTFFMHKADRVYLQDSQGAVFTVYFNDLSAADQAFVQGKDDQIARLNSFNPSVSNPEVAQSVPYGKYAFVFCLLLLAGLLAMRFLEKQSLRYVMPVLGFGVMTLLYSFSGKPFHMLQAANDPIAMDSAFAPFRPNVHTFWDATYFHVESRGIPATHEMMVGISNHGWQQQVPIPQCYMDTNSWSIPLNPVMAASPIPVDSVHFTRGAIAIAVNGVPIFNVHTNTGVDSYIDGQLDIYGGHCGRADDYHYHIAPLSLYSYTSEHLPIAYGLDGFAVFGSTEPDGSAMQTLDANHGHLGTNGVYHYHGTATAPYMIAAMAGEVTEDATHQLIPQPAAHPVRPSLTPLNGALITACTPNANNNGYNLTYTLNGVTDSVVYSWTNNGQYTFNFYVGGVLTTNNYNGFTQCTVPLTPVGITPENSVATELNIYPNPVTKTLFVSGTNGVIRIFSIDGKQVFEANTTIQNIDVSRFDRGLYMLSLENEKGRVTKKFIVQ